MFPSHTHITKDWTTFVGSILCFFLSSLSAKAQQTIVFDTENIRSAQLIVDDDPLLPPVIQLGNQKQLQLHFDYMSHEPQRLVYHISHCNYKWEKGEDESVFESDYISGLNGQVIEDYETSFNTTQNYTHYRFCIPTDELRILISGNYRIEIFQESDYDGGQADAPLLRAEFCVLEPLMGINAQVTSNTDIDFNQSHQQVSYSVSYGTQRVVNPSQELHTVVLQNRRYDNAVIDLQPNQQTASGIAFSHRKELIFPAGNEFHKFETTDMKRPTLGIDNLRWYDPYYHATLFTDKRQHNYTYDQDQNGCFVLRNTEWDDAQITSEYIWVHFSLSCEEPLPGGPVYICGLWTNGSWDESLRMEYDPDTHEYQGKAFLKQGYYNYQYRQPDDQGRGRTILTEGDFYETENEYTILVYHRPQGARYDKLVGFRTLKIK